MKKNNFEYGQILSVLNNIGILLYICYSTFFIETRRSTSRKGKTRRRRKTKGIILLNIFEKISISKILLILTKKIEAYKKEKEQQKKLIKKERKSLRTVVKDFNYFAGNEDESTKIKNMEKIEQLIEILSLNE